MQTGFFAIQGDFTTTKLLRDALRRLRESVSADFAICLAFHNKQKAFYHVSLTSCTDRRLEASLDRCVRRSLEQLTKGPEHQIIGLADGETLMAVRFEALLPLIHSNLYVEHQLPDHWRVIRCNARDAYPDVTDQLDGVAVDLLCFVSWIDSDDKKFLAAALSEPRRDLLLAANCSVQIATERIHQIGKTAEAVDRSVALLESSGGELGAGQFAHVAKAAAEILKSDCVHIFEHVRERQHLVRKASFPAGRPCHEIVDVTHEKQGDSPNWSMLYHVFKKRKPIVVNEIDPDDRQPLGWRDNPPTGANRVRTLVVPIVERTFGQVRYRTRGVVVFERGETAAGDRRAFGLFDLIKARIIASRLTNALDRIKWIESEDEIEKLARKMSEPLDPPPIEWERLTRELKSLSSPAGNADEGSDWELYDVPSDLLRAKPRLQELVRQVPRWFECDFVSIRLLSANMQKLVLLASSCEVDAKLHALPVAWPETDPPKTSTSVVEKVVTSAGAVLVRRMERGNKWQDVRGCEAPQVVTGDHNSDINSVFSVPLVHAGRVLGALTFESKNRFAFQSHRTWVANRLAAIAADALAAARAAASSRVLGMTSLLAVKLHDLKKAVELLLSAEKELTNESMIKAIRGALEFLSPLFGSASRDDSAILDMSRDDPDWLTALDRGEDVPVKLLYGNVLKGLCDQRGYYPTLRDRDLDPIAGLLVGAADVRPAAIAIHAVLDNVLKESKADGFRYLAEGKKRPVRIIGESRTKWGTTFANLKILGPCVAPELLQVLYQFPYRRDQEDGSERAGKPHFGAFIAGNGMRGIGGDVYVELLTEGSLCTVIQIPVTWRSET